MERLLFGATWLFERYRHAEKAELEFALGEKVFEGRQHVLRFEAPTTWTIWEGANMDLDSTLGFADHVGFRAGIAEQYPVFDVLERKTLNLEEAPLVVMDSSLKDYQLLTPNDAKAKIDLLIDRVFRVNGLFVLLYIFLANFFVNSE